MDGMRTDDGRRVRAALALFGVSLVLFVACQGRAGEPTIEPTGASAASTATAVASTGLVTGTDVAATSTVTATSVAVPEGLPFAQHAEYREYESAELAAAGFVDTGEFLRVPGNPFPIAESSYRAGFTAVRASGDGFVSFDGEPDVWSGGFPPGGGWSGGNAIGLKATIGGRALYLTFSGEWGIAGGDSTTRIMQTGNDSAAFYALGSNRTRPTNLMVGVADAEGRRYPVIVDSSGHLWVRVAPILAGPVANDTGELVGVGSAERLGPLPGAVGNWRNLTWCDGGTCLAVIHTHDGGGLPAPVSGTATCQDDVEAVIELDSGRYRLVFEAALAFGSSAARCGDRFPREVVEGELLSRHPSWEVTAFGADGEQLNVVADREWMLYIGADEPEITECPPCYTGN